MKKKKCLSQLHSLFIWNSIHHLPSSLFLAFLVKWILTIHKTQRGFDLESNHGRTKEHFQGNKVTRCCKLQAFTSRSRAHKHLHNLLGPTDVANEDFESIFLPTGVHKPKHKMFHIHDSVTTPYHSNANDAGSAGWLNIVYTYHIRRPLAFFEGEAKRRA